MPGSKPSLPRGQKNREDPSALRRHSPSGATLYVMVFGVVPFWGHNGQEVADNVTSQALTFPDAPISRTLRMLLRRMLEKDLLIRITLNEILDDPWVTGETSWQVFSPPFGMHGPADGSGSQVGSTAPCPKLRFA